MSHDHHEALPGYSPAQLLHDGCPECEDRGENPGDVIDRLDPAAFVLGWQRAADWQHGRLHDVAGAEAATLRALWACRWQLERAGVRIGAAT